MNVANVQRRNSDILLNKKQSGEKSSKNPNGKMGTWISQEVTQRLVSGLYPQYTPL